METLVFRSSTLVIKNFQTDFNFFRISHFFNHCKAFKASDYKVLKCPECHLWILIPYKALGIVNYCYECKAMFRSQASLCWSQNCYYNFSKDAFFSRSISPSKLRFLPSSQSCEFPKDSYQKLILPYLEKILSHTLWLFFWMVLFYFTDVFFHSLVLLCFVIHIFFLCTYLTNFYIFASPFSFLSRSLWDRLTYEFKSGRVSKESKDLIEKDLAYHPGHLSNLACAYFIAGNEKEAWNYLDKSIKICPNHPVLLSLAHRFSPESKKLFWLDRIKQMKAFG